MGWGKCIWYEDDQMPPALSHPDEVNDSDSLSNHKTVNALNRAKCAYSTQTSKA